jgi:hypothetical protein
MYFTGIFHCDHPCPEVFFCCGAIRVEATFALPSVPERSTRILLSFGWIPLVSVGFLFSLVRCAVVSLHSVVKQRLKCTTGRVCNCLIQFVLPGTSTAAVC